MFTATKPHKAMTRTDALKFAALVLYLSQLSLDGVIWPDFFDALSFPALLHWIPTMLVVGGRVHHRIALPHALGFRSTKRGSVQAIATTAAVVVLAVSAAYGLAAREPAVFELAPASGAFAYDAITT